MHELRTLLAQEGDPAQVLGRWSDLAIYPRSVMDAGESLFFLGRRGRVKRLGVLTLGREPSFDLETRAVTLGGRRLTLGLGELHAANAAALRARLPFTAPQAVGVRKSVGLGDRLGLATPGHLRALRHTKGLFPILAQQSMREMERTGRTPQQVLDAATWGVFQEGWQEGWGTDADHLKTEQDLNACAAAGFILYTLDPRDHVDNQAETDALPALAAKFAALPWGALASTPEATRAAYLGRAWNLGAGQSLSLSEEQLLRAAAKYGRAIAHLAALARHLQRLRAGQLWELEISVDETDTPTRPEEHFYLASELRRLGVQWVSLAPRFVGRFEKGVDYIGDLDRFAADFARHVAIARALGPYKLSLHSGSDKFSIYPIAARAAGELVHLKTAGTSYLEALRAVARVQPELFREILAFALAHYERDRASYHVSAQMSRVPDPKTLTEQALVEVLDQFDARQALHVTFGSVLTAQDAAGHYLFRDRLFAVLEGDEEAHYAALETHILKHILPFSN
jgi:hypothetical protein